MSSITDQMTTRYCFVDDFLRARPGQAAWRASNNARPAFTDAEVLTVTLMQAVKNGGFCQGRDTAGALRPGPGAGKL